MEKRQKAKGNKIRLMILGFNLKNLNIIDYIYYIKNLVMFNTSIFSKKLFNPRRGGEARGPREKGISEGLPHFRSA